jgi:hypothetical protein
MAAIYAMLARGRSPARLLAVYVVVGILFTIAVGVLVIASFSGIDLRAGTDHTKGIAEIAGGILALGIGFGILTGRIRSRRRDDPIGELVEAPPATRAQDPSGASSEPPAGEPTRWARVLARPITTRTAALAGPVTHLPGLLYLLALDLIVARQHSFAAGLFDVLLYNLVWFALPIAALLVCALDPARAEMLVGAIQSWTSEHARPIALFVCFFAGIGLLLAGLVTV